MNENIIIDEVNRLYKEHEKYNDNDAEIIRKICSKINNTTQEERDFVIKFFINEIRTNKNNLRYLGFEVIEKLQLKEGASIIYSIYNETKNDIDYEFEWHIITTLMKLGYNENKEIYTNYINNYLIENKWGRSFLLLIWYGLVDTNNSLILLADYYCKRFIENGEYMPYLSNHNFDALLFHIHHNNIDYILNLIKMIYKKNEVAGKFLQNNIIKFMNSLWIDRGNYNKVIIKEQLIQVQNVI